MYCDFYSIVYQSAQAASYIEVLCRQIDTLPLTFDTMYIGGGTPTLLEEGLCKKFFGSLRKKRARICEFTVEANPESLSFEKIRIMRDCGVNRISIGLQSLSDAKLKRLGRIHTAQEAIDAVLRARSAGFRNISIDCMYGVWGESFLDWRKELKKIVQLPVKHISAYSLTYEKHTPLFRQCQDKKIKPLEEAVVAQMFSYNITYLPSKGFFHYEVSNFAKRGFRCRHNLNYWSNNNYWALGAGAVCCNNGRRIRYKPDVIAYTECLNRKKEPVCESEELLPQERARETAALKIRTKEGINFDWFNRATGYDFLELTREALARLGRHGLIRYWPSKSKALEVCLTKKGFLYCDEVSTAFL